VLHPAEGPRSSRDKQAVVRDLAWFDRAYQARLGKRYRTFRAAFALLLERTGPNRAIVETGCVREKNDYSAGYSTVLFGEFLERGGGRLFTVDLSPQNMALCRRITRRYQRWISYHVGDSIAFLAAWAMTQPRVEIDLLYLDSFDYELEPNRDAAREASQRHCLGELEAALPSLARHALVLIDDGDLPGGGKPRLAKRRLAELGWTCVLDDYQTLWSAPSASGASIPSSSS